MMAMKRLAGSCLRTKSPSHRRQWGRGWTEAGTRGCGSDGEGRRGQRSSGDWTRGLECQAQVSPYPQARVGGHGQIGARCSAERQWAKGTHILGERCLWLD